MRLLEKDRLFNCNSLEIEKTKKDIYNYYRDNNIDNIDNDKINELIARSRLCSIRKEADLNMEEDYYDNKVQQAKKDWEYRGYRKPLFE